MAGHDTLDRKSLWAWMSFDWAGTVFPVIVITFIFPPYFTNNVAPNPILGTTYWGYTMAISTFFIALLSPFFGSIADHMGQRKPWTVTFSILVILLTACLWFIKPNVHYMVFMMLLVGAAVFCYEISQVFYNAMLPDLVPESYLGRASGIGWGLAHLGSIFFLLGALFWAMYTPSGSSHHAQLISDNVRVLGPVIAFWFTLFAIPFILFIHDKRKSRTSLSNAIKKGIGPLITSLRALPRDNPDILRFLVARVFYMDGLNTLFMFGPIYAAGTFHFNLKDILLFGIALNVSSALGAVCFAPWVDRIGARKILILSLIAMTILSGLTVAAHSISLFWILATLSCIFIGPVQSGSRAFLAKHAPREKMSELFGLYALAGRVTSFLGPWLFATLTLLFHSQRAGMIIIVVFFALGAIILKSIKFAD